MSTSSTPSSSVSTSSSSVDSSSSGSSSVPPLPPRIRAQADCEVVLQLLPQLLRPRPLSAGVEKEFCET